MLVSRTAASLGSLLAAAMLVTGCAVSRQPPPSQDGLVLQPSRGLDAVYLRPGVDFRTFNDIVLEPVQVSFDKDWDPNSSQRDLSRRLSEQDIQKMRDEMAKTFREIFVKELESGGYQVVDRAGSDSLIATASLNDVYVNAPDKMAPGRSRTYTMESGRMTLLLELHDSVSGQLIGRIADKKIGDNFGRLEITDSVTNSADFRRAVSDWAVRLRKGLDTLRSTALPPPPQ